MKAGVSHSYGMVGRACRHVTLSPRAAALAKSRRFGMPQCSARFTGVGVAARLTQFADPEAALTDRSPDPSSPFDIDPAGVDSPPEASPD